MTPNRDFARRFDSVAESFDDITNGYSVHRRQEALSPFLQGTILNAGTGTGCLSHVCSPDRNIVHLDISLNMCRVALKKTGQPVVCADAEALPVGDERVDAVVSSEMIYYLNGPERFFKEAFRCLKPGGVLAVTSADQDAAFYDRLRSFLRRIRRQGAYFEDGVGSFMKKKQMDRLFRENGFKVVMSGKFLIIPFRPLEWLDRRLERTPLSRYGAFFVMAGVKIEKALETADPQPGMGVSSRRNK